MRDILTGLAIVVILALTAALAVPPFVNWEGRRDIVERALRDALGVGVVTEGRIRVRLLPSPRLRLDSVAIGGDDASVPRVAGRFVTAEVALTPLLKGEFRFTEARIGRLDLRVPLARDGSWTVPEALVSRDQGIRSFAFEQVRVAQFAVTAVDASTGRTEQIFAQDVTIEAPALSGPWRLEGIAGAVPFRLVTGEPGADRALAVKATGGGDRSPRFDLDGRIQMVEAGRHLVPRLEGQLRVQLGPPAQPPTAGVPVPVSVQTTFKSETGAILLERVAVEAGEGAAALRLGGVGRIDLRARSIDIGLDAKRFDLDGLLGAAGFARLSQGLVTPADWRLPWPTFVRLGLGSVGLAGEEIADVGLSVEAGPRGFLLHRIDATLPGQSRASFVGEAAFTADGRADGHVEIASRNSDRLARFLADLGVAPAWLAPFDGRPLSLSADVAVADQAISLRRMRFGAGDGTITGALRFQLPALGSRGRLEALLAAENVDIAQLPRFGGVAQLPGGVDLALTLDARGLRDGARAGAGRVAAKIVSDGAALVVETLDVTDLAGANVRMAGRITPDGAGRIAGRVTAQRAAPLVDLVGRVWSDALAGMVPPFLRAGGLDLEVALERAGGAGAAGGLTTTARGTAAGGRLAVEIRSDEQGPSLVDVTLATADTARWLGAEHPAVSRRPGEIRIQGSRSPDGRVTATATGEIAGVRIETVNAFAYAPSERALTSGTARIVTGDLRPVLALFSLGMAPVSAPADLTVALGRERGLPQLTLGGRIAGEEVRARFSVPGPQDLAGDLTLPRLSLPWLAEVLSLGFQPETRPPALWASTRFAEPGRAVVGGQARLRIGRLDLGRGIVADEATLLLSVTPEGFAVRDLEARLGGGRIAGMAGLARQGRQVTISGEGSLADVPLSAVSATPWGGRLTASLRFGASGESQATLVANLAGSGTVRLSDLAIPQAEPGAVDRALARALRDDDPLAARKLDGFLAEEFNRGPAVVPALSGSVTMVGGVLRLNALTLDFPPARWGGVAGLDFKSGTVEIRGALSSRTAPKGWSGSNPFAILSWRGPIGAPQREIDAGPMVNGLAAIVLQRELEKIEAFEAEANERTRLQNRLDYERDRRERMRRAAEEAERQARLQREREEAERLARLKAEQEAEKLRLIEEERQARAQREADRQARIRAEREAAERARFPAPQPAPLVPPLLPPLDIRPPAASAQPGG